MEPTIAKFARDVVSVELEEPFSDTDEEDEAVRKKRATHVRPHLNLPLPRGRIRTLSGTVPTTGFVLQPLRYLSPSSLTVNCDAFRVDSENREKHLSLDRVSKKSRSVMR